MARNIRTGSILSQEKTAAIARLRLDFHRRRQSAVSVDSSSYATENSALERRRAAPHGNFSGCLSSRLRKKTVTRLPDEYKVLRFADAWGIIPATRTANSVV